LSASHVTGSGQAFTAGVQATDSYGTGLAYVADDDNP